MHKLLLAFFITGFCCHYSNAALKEVVFNWNSPSILWETKTGYAPCLEPFNLKVIDCPPNTSFVEIFIYESNDEIKMSRIVKDARSGQRFTAVSKGNNEFLAFISKKLAFRRYYYFEVKITVTTSVSVNSTSGVTVQENTNDPNPDANPHITTTVITTTTVPPAAATASNSPVVTTVTTTKTEHKYSKEAEKVYALPLKTEISSLEFLGSLGGATFFQSGWTHSDTNLGIVTGLKIKIRPVSSNPDIGRFGLYPIQSRFSFVIGTLINEVQYKETDITSSFIGLKPVIGLDLELFNGSVGLTGGTVIGNQQRIPALNDSKNTVFGLFFGLSFSADVFKKLKNNTPANSNFPTTP